MANSALGLNVQVSTLWRFLSVALLVLFCMVEGAFRYLKTMLNVIVVVTRSELLSYDSASTRQLIVVCAVLVSVGGGAAGVELGGISLYGGLFQSSSTVAYAEVVQTCFGGMEVGSCEASSPGWLEDYLYTRNGGDTGAYCTSCCFNAGNTWTFECELISTAFAEFVNKFGWEFRFGRRETTSDTEVITCPIPRTACAYLDNGTLLDNCETDGSFLASYILTVEVMAVEKGLTSWKSVQGCSVKVEETEEEPSLLVETLVMTQVYGDTVSIEVGWALCIAFCAFAVCSCGVRYWRDDYCTVCGHHLIYFRMVCSPCRFYGYDPPSKDVAKIIKEKRAVVLPEPTLTERVGNIKASTTKVFVQATEILRSSAFGSSTNARFASSASRQRMTGESRDSGTKSGGGVGLHGREVVPSARRAAVGVGGSDTIGWLSPMSSARSVTFADDILHGSAKGRKREGGTLVAKKKNSIGGEEEQRPVDKQNLRSTTQRRS